ncbi:peptidase dimerization domain-containing protein, partial [Terriglobus sp. YAF25]
LEGAGTENVVVGAIGSRRLQATITGPGGHSWTEAGAPNPIVVLSKAIAAMERIKLPRQPRTTWNIGRIEGGMSVTSVPERASCLIDLRSVDMDQLISLEVQVHRALEDAVLEANDDAGDRRLSLHVATIGDRPAGTLSTEAALLETIHAVDRHLRLRTELRIGSTDANVPLALGREAIAVGAGGIAGGIHTHSEWFDPAGRELALRRVLLILLDAAR